ncbi:MAG: PAS domain S-box protein [Methylococcaceae bacterium]
MSTKTSRPKPTTALSRSESRISSLPANATPDTLIAALLEHITDPVCLLDIPDGYLLGMNTGAKELLGYSSEELNTKGSIDWNGFLTSLPTLDNASDKQNGTLPFHRKDNTLLTLHYSSSVMYSGSVPCLLVKLRQKSGLDSPNMLRDDTVDQSFMTLVDTFEESIVVIDELGSICVINTAAEQMFGYFRQEAVGLDIQNILPINKTDLDTGISSEHATANNLRVKKGEAEQILPEPGIKITGRHRDGHPLSLYFTLSELHQGNRHWFLGIARNITHDQESDNTLLVLSSAVEQSPSAILLTNLSGRVTYANEAYMRLSGYAAEEVLGKHAGVILSDSQTSDQYQRLRRTMQLGGVSVGDFSDYTKNGEMYWVSEMISPLHDSRGLTTHYVIVQRDITESIKDKEALRQSEERFRSVADMVGEWLWEQDTEGCYTYSSAAVSTILGFQPDEIVGKSYLALLSTEDREYWGHTQPLTTRFPRPFHKLINRYVHKDGFEIYTESSGAPLFDEHGKLLKWRGMDQDITAHRQVEDILRTQERAMESASVGIAICDARQYGYPVIYANPALSDITGYARDELVGNSLKMLQGPLTESWAKESIRTNLQTGMPCKVLICNYRKNGTPFWNELLLSPVRDQEGTVTHYVGIQSDVTDQLQMTEERHQLEIARQIQLSLLPKKSISLPGMEVAGLCLPTAQVGGDYFDYFNRGDWLDIVIADVSGHNVGAALIMTELRSALRAGLYLTDSIHPDYSPAYVLGVLNELLYEDLNAAELFISMFYLRYDLRTRILYYANAGHNRVLLVRQGSGDHEELDAEGMILGVQPRLNFDEREVILEPGDRLLLYTDGAVETQDKTGDFFGIERLAKVFIHNRELPPDENLHSIQQALNAFSGQTDFRDDITLVSATITVASQPL